MIQRIQSVYLFLTAAVSGVLFFVTLATFEYTNPLELTILGVGQQTDTVFFSDTYTIPLLLLNIVMTVLPIVTIFLYKKMGLQLKTARFNLFVIAVFIALVFMYYVPDMQKTLACNDQTTHYGVGMYIVLSEIVFNILAIRGIRKDIALIRSMDRIR